MTDTQFQVGKVYATRGGDRVMHTEVDKDSPYPLAGYFLSGPRQRDFGNWCANGRYREDCEHPLDLLPGALPEPAAEGDRVAELEGVLLELREAVTFFDKVKTAPEDERVAAGTDHWDWLERAARKAIKALGDQP